MTESKDEMIYDYIVVGSGAGGGPLAARLAQRGFNVLVIEAGSASYPQYSQIPLLHPQSTEDPSISWAFMVRHYADDERAKKDPKADADGRIFYPRAGALGGCTIHNAMITICGGNDEWNRIAQLTGDDSWTGARMRKYFERLERCTYVRKPTTAEGNPGQHGFNGWLTTSFPDLSIVGSDLQLQKVILSAVHALFHEQVDDPEQIVRDLLLGRAKKVFDPNDWRRLKNVPDGFTLVPLATREAQRNGPRDFLLEMERACRDLGSEKGSLTIRTNALVTKVLFEDGDAPSRNRRGSQTRGKPFSGRSEFFSERAIRNHANPLQTRSHPRGRNLQQPATIVALRYRAGRPVRTSSVSDAFLIFRESARICRTGTRWRSSTRCAKISGSSKM